MLAIVASRALEQDMSAEKEFAAVVPLCAAVGLSVWGLLLVVFWAKEEDTGFVSETCGWDRGNTYQVRLGVPRGFWLGAW